MRLLQAYKEFGCDQTGVLFSWFLGPLVHAARDRCQTVLAVPASAKESRKNLVVLQNPKHWKDVQRTCASMARGGYPVQRNPSGAVPSRREGPQQQCQPAGICSHGVKTPLMLITRALVLQLHMRVIQYACLRVFLDPSWL